MKNRYLYSIVLVLTGAVLFDACNKDEQFIEMKARIVTYGDNGSKVYVDAPSANWTARYANWHNGDKVKINNEEKIVVMGTESNVPTASISRVQSDNNGYFAIYPSDRVISYSVNTTSDDTEEHTQSYRILLPQVQIHEMRNEHQLINAPMAAYCPSRGDGTHSLDFKNLCSLIEVDVPVGTEVAYINVTSDNRFLWGEATVTTSMTEGATPTLTLDANGTIQSDYNTSNHTVTLDCTTNGSNGSNDQGGTHAASGHKTTADDHLFYVVVPADTYTNLKVDVYVFDETETASAVYSRSVKRYTYSGTSTSVAGNKIYSVVCSGTPSPVQPEYPGLGTGEFSVSATKKVRFSQGNLQYLASKDMWSFSNNELAALGGGEGNCVINNRDNQDLWIDLFGFGTSGQTQYSPTMYTSSNDEYPNDDISATNLYDWGVNEISNGGNQPNKWRTLTRTEWQYLLNVNNNIAARSGRQGICAIRTGSTSNDPVVACGVIIAPDSYNPGWVYGSAVNITMDQWNTYKANGCVFLPVTGYRRYNNDNIIVDDFNSISTPAGSTGHSGDGYYWSSTKSDNGYAWAYKQICPTNAGGTLVNCVQIQKSDGCAVRLVRDVD